MNAHTSAGPRLAVDFTRCEGHGACIDLLPEVLTDDPWGYPLSPAGTSLRAGMPLAPEQLGEARRAVRLCPRLALHLVGGAP